MEKNSDFKDMFNKLPDQQPVRNWKFMDTNQMWLGEWEDAPDFDVRKEDYGSHISLDSIDIKNKLVTDSHGKVHVLGKPATEYVIFLKRQIQLATQLLDIFDE